ncbi:hypothetical protein LXL04_015481 [Taraxacum kok-saghyz]
MKMSTTPRTDTLLPSANIKIPNNNNPNQSLQEKSHRSLADRDDKMGTKATQSVFSVIKSGSFENSYIPENPRTPKPLTFSKNRLRGAKNRSNTSPVAKIFSEKTTFFFKNYAYVQFFFHICIFYVFVSKTLKCLKIKRKKKVAYMQKKKKVARRKNKKKNRFSEKKKNKRIIMIINVLKGPEVGFFERNNGLGDIENWGSSRVLGNMVGVIGSTTLVNTGEQGKFATKFNHMNRGANGREAMDICRTIIELNEIQVQTQESEKLLPDGVEMVSAESPRHFSKYSMYNEKL